MTYPESTNHRDNKRMEVIWGWDEDGEVYLLHTEFLFGVMEIFWKLLVMMIVQHCQYT